MTSYSFCGVLEGSAYTCVCVFRCNLWPNTVYIAVGIYDIYLLTEIGFPPGGSSTVHIYTQTIHRTTQNKQYVEQHTNFGRVRAVSLFASYTVAFALQLRKKHRKPQVKAGIGRYSGECPLLEFLW